MTNPNVCAVKFYSTSPLAHTSYSQDCYNPQADTTNQFETGNPPMIDNRRTRRASPPFNLWI